MLEMLTGAAIAFFGVIVGACIAMAKKSDKEEV